MKTYSGPEVLIDNLNAEQLFGKLSNLNNLRNVIPDSIEFFDSTEDTCTVKMKGIPELFLSISEKIPFSKITISTNKSPVFFSLPCYITNCGLKCQARIEVNAELNMMMEMMLKKPINDFIKILSEKIGRI